MVESGVAIDPGDAQSSVKICIFQICLALLALLAVPVTCATVLFWPFGLMLSPLLLVPPFIGACMWPYDSGFGKRVSLFLSWTWKTYTVWALFSLASFNMLGGLALPFLLPTMWNSYERFVPFMQPPFACALFVACLFYAGARLFLPAWRRRAFGPFLFNIVLLAGVMLFAECYRRLLVEQDLKLHHPSCVRTDSFYNSLLAGWEDFQFHVHGTMVENGVTYLWSYKERGFVPLPGLKGWSC